MACKLGGITDRTDVGTRGMMNAFRALVTEVMCYTRTMDLDCIGAVAMVSTGMLDMGSMGTMAMNRMTMVGTLVMGSMGALVMGSMTMMGMAAMSTSGMVGDMGSLTNLDLGNLDIMGIMNLGGKMCMCVFMSKVGTRMYDLDMMTSTLLRDRTCRSSPQPPPLKFFPMMRTKSNLRNFFTKIVV